MVVQVSTDLNDPRFTAVGLFAEAFTGLTNRFATQLDQHRLSTVEFEVMMRLARSPGRRLRMTDLAAQTSLSTSGVTRVVDRMDRAGLIRREACSTDRRSSYAVITDKGLSRLDDLLPDHLELIERWLVQPLTPAQYDAFLDALRALRDAVNPCATAGSDEPAELPAEAQNA
ncbi:MarR family transcriptional regulator [Actinoplanes sp. NPDC051633]|uniref:MarR family winged helix-turn-helix transcriptional regulator n=1 Tax=Actinoplanes sp. NPDC051633 TaxID=3155670 RepID=UPI003414A5D2